jgi:uncharacterized protein (DUF2249 family)
MLSVLARTGAVTRLADRLPDVGSPPLFRSNSREEFMSLIQIEHRRAPAELDVRELTPRDRHALIFQTFDALKPGESFVLVNDHDPKPLYYEFQAEQPGKVRWEYLEQGPEVWRVRLGRLLDLGRSPVLEIVTAYPQVEPVLDGFGLDTCCGSHMTVDEASADSGADAAQVFAAMRHALE